MENVFIYVFGKLCFFVFFVLSTKKTTGFKNYLSILMSPISQPMIRLNKNLSLVFGEIRALNKSYKTRNFNLKLGVYKQYRNDNCLRPKKRLQLVLVLSFRFVISFTPK